MTRDLGKDIINLIVGVKSGSIELKLPAYRNESNIEVNLSNGELSLKPPEDLSRVRLFQNESETKFLNYLLLLLQLQVERWVPTQ